MKKLSLLAIVALSVSFASCKKDYTCTCTNAFGGGSTTKIKSTSKSGAQSHCVSGTTAGTGYSYASTCTLSK